MKNKKYVAYGSVILAALVAIAFVIIQNNKKAIDNIPAVTKK